MPRVRLDRVTKIYRRQSRQFLWRFLLQTLGGRRAEPIYALRDVSFELASGQAMAVIGRNGAGKSTLLSLVAGLTAPESGLVEVDGRVLALLELGSGFHPDLTGAENLRVNAALCGLTRRQTEERFEEIVEFAELADFIDEPLRTYSQGMILRLAFSVAVHADADILLLDEMIAVGDVDFQRKSFRRIREMKQQGRILLCVSHVPEILKELCEEAIWLESGRIVLRGPAEQVIDASVAGAPLYESSP
jgi:ABC-type polysaccharide/polyol phosphate transport system ATPase subunit